MFEPVVFADVVAHHLEHYEQHQLTAIEPGAESNCDHMITSQVLYQLGNPAKQFIEFPS